MAISLRVLFSAVVFFSFANFSQAEMLFSNDNQLQGAPVSHQPIHKTQHYHKHLLHKKVAKAEVHPKGNPSDICRPFTDPNVEPQLSNCKLLVERNLVPNPKALSYTINYLMNNHKKLKDPRCAEDGIFNPDSTHHGDTCDNCRDKKFIEKGIDNDCSFVLNDLKQPWTAKGEQAKNRTTAYFVNLCPKPGEKMVETFYINGSSHDGYDDVPTENLADAPSNSHTLQGAFLLNDQMKNDFFTGHPDKYEAISRQFGGDLNHQSIPAIRMVGLNSSNNTTEFDKPLHVSAFNTGLGCAGVNIKTYPIMQKIVSNGSSLYMAYAGPQSEQKGDVCKNDRSDEHSPQLPSTSPANQGPRRNSVVKNEEESDRSIASVETPSRYVFDIHQAGSVIEKMQIDLVDKDHRLFADSKYLAADGTKGKVELVCRKVMQDEFNCWRGDNGGSFDLVLVPSPRMTVSYFSADQEDAPAQKFVLQEQNNKVIVIDGKKAVYSSKDLF